MSLKQDPFYMAALTSASRRIDRRLQHQSVSRVIVKIKQKFMVAAGGNGVFVTFSSEGNNQKNVVQGS
jgi:hypothetical protein